MSEEKSGKTYRPMRRLTQMGAEIVSDAGIANVSLDDISRDGARISPGLWLAPGSAVTLKIAGQELPAVVHWSKKSSAGLRFLQRPDVETLRLAENDALPRSR